MTDKLFMSRLFRGVPEQAELPQTALLPPMPSTPTKASGSAIPPRSPSHPPPPFLTRPSFEERMAYQHEAHPFHLEEEDSFPLFYEYNPLPLMPESYQIDYPSSSSLLWSPREQEEQPSSSLYAYLTPPASPPPHQSTSSSSSQWTPMFTPPHSNQPPALQHFYSPSSPTPQQQQQYQRPPYQAPTIATVAPWMISVPQTALISPLPPGVGRVSPKIISLTPMRHKTQPRQSTAPSVLPRRSSSPAILPSTSSNIAMPTPVSAIPLTSQLPLYTRYSTEEAHRLKSSPVKRAPSSRKRTASRRQVEATTTTTTRKSTTPSPPLLAEKEEVKRTTTIKRPRPVLLNRAGEEEEELLQRAPSKKKRVPSQPSATIPRVAPPPPSSSSSMQGIEKTALPSRSHSTSPSSVPDLTIEEIKTIQHIKAKSPMARKMPWTDISTQLPNRTPEQLNLIWKRYESLQRQLATIRGKQASNIPLFASEKAVLERAIKQYPHLFKK